jgi:hypothetical protein
MHRQHRSVVAGSGVVEKCMVRMGFDNNVIGQLGTIEGGFDRRLGRRYPGIESCIDCQYCSFGAGEFGVVG